MWGTATASLFLEFLSQIHHLIQFFSLFPVDGKGILSLGYMFSSIQTSQKIQSNGLYFPASKKPSCFLCLSSYTSYSQNSISSI